MKASLCIFVGIIILSVACTKSDVKPSSVVTASSTANASVKTRSAILVAHKWVYNALYFHYVDQQHKGDAQYIRGAANNIINLDKTVYSFKNDGSFVELDGGYKYPGKWNFTDNTASLLFLDYTYWSDKDSILIMTNQICNYTSPIGYHDKSYTEWKAVN